MMTSLSGLNLTALVTRRDFKNTCIYKLVNACLYTFHGIGAWSFFLKPKSFSRISFFFVSFEISQLWNVLKKTCIKVMKLKNLKSIFGSADLAVNST